MADYNASPADDLRKWLWFEMQDNGIVNAADYNITGIGQIIPIIPVQQQKELVDKVSGKPFVTYDIVTSMVPSGMWYIFNDQILFTVFCEDFRTARAIRNLMVDLFRRQDDSARELNEFSDSEFAYLNLTILENRNVNAERGDQGRLSFDMIVGVTYVRDLNTNGRFS